MVVTRLNSKPYYRRKRTLRKIIFLIVFLFVASVGFSTYVGWNLTHPRSLGLNDTPAHYQLSYENIEFSSRNSSLKLKGWFLPPKQTDKTIIIAHGYNKNRLQDDVPALSLVQSLVAEGYQVVMFDFRDSGESDGKLSSVGEYEEQDLLGAVNWVKDNHPSKIGLIGFSMGASTALLAAADEPSIVTVIADSPFNNLKAYLNDHLPTWSHVWKYPFTPLIMNILPILTGMHPDRVDPLTAVDRIYPRPILFIHSVDDPSIPYLNSEVMYLKHPDKFEFWKTAKAGHVGSYKLDPKLYTERVLDFLKKLN